MQAVIFDLDGTLLDSEIIWVEAVELALRQAGADLESAEVITLVYGRGWREIYEDIQRRFPGRYESDAALQEATRRHFEQLQQQRDISIHSSVALLRELAQSYPAAVVSGSPRTMVAHGISLLGIGPLLRFYLGAEDYARGKPAPDGFLKGARMLNVPPSECLVFEDSAAGVQAAKAAGMSCVALQRPDRPPQDVTGADEILEDLQEFSLERFL